MRQAGPGRVGSLATLHPEAPPRRSQAAAMDVPPLAGKIAVLSLGALPLSYALNHLSALS